MAQQPPKLAYNIAEACVAIGMNKSFLYRAMSRGQLQSFKLGRRRLISADALREFVRVAEAEQQAPRGRRN